MSNPQDELNMIRMQLLHANQKVSDVGSRLIEGLKALIEPFSRVMEHTTKAAMVSGTISDGNIAYSQKIAQDMDEKVFKSLLEKNQVLKKENQNKESMESGPAPSRPRR